MSASANMTLLRRAWEAMSGAGDLSVLEGMLAPEATWRGVEDGPFKCENRQMIIEVMSRNLASGLAGKIEEMMEVGKRIVVAFRPSRSREDGRPLDQGIAYVVVTVLDGQVTELKGCADRGAAVKYARGGAT